MFHPNKPNQNYGLATMQRTFNPKHCSYWGNVTGRDAQIILNSGGFTKCEKQFLGHTGVH